jgi:hypothetical protein
MRLRIIVTAALVIFAGCTDDGGEQVADLERRVARLEATVATSTTTSTTTTTIDPATIPPVELPTEQAETRLMRTLPAAPSRPRPV